MLNTRDSCQVMDQEFLLTRCRIMDLAAALDRLDRAPEHHHHHHPDQRMSLIRQALDILLQPGPDRAETIQRLFSLEYDPNWQAEQKPDRRF